MHSNLLRGRSGTGGKKRQDRGQEGKRGRDCAVLKIP